MTKKKPPPKKTAPAKKPVPVVKKAVARKKPAVPRKPRTAAPAPKDSLSASQALFVQAYLQEPNALRAYKAAHPRVKDSTAGTEGYKTLKNPQVAAAIAAAQDDRAEKAGITARRALEEAWNIATADARELVEYRIGCCRFCWGEDHLYQRTPNEMRRDEDTHARLCEEAITAGKETPGEFDPKGGVGYDERKDPHPDCPECFGRGVGRTLIRDTSKLSAQAVALYAGVKETKDGFEVKTNSKDAALEKVFKHLGLYERDNSQKTPPAPESVVFAMDEKALLAIAASAAGKGPAA